MHSLNAPLRISFTEESKFIWAKDEQQLKEPIPIWVTDEGIVIWFNDVHLKKA